MDLQSTIETERETDDRWIAEIPEIPGALAYGGTEQQAKAKARALAGNFLRDRDEGKDISPAPTYLETLKL
jgi:predicted RNase H-like HicB family nuclease